MFAAILKPASITSTNKSSFQLTSTTGLQSSHALTGDVKNQLARCPSEYYIIVTQNGVSTSDYTNSKTVPVLARNLSPSAKGIQSQLTISELLDEPNTSSWETVLSENCNTESLDIDASTGSIPSLKSHNLLKINLPAPSSSTKSADLTKNDAYLASVLDLIPSKDYTVLYVTNPTRKAKSAGSISESTKQYEMDTPMVDYMHQELKRDLGIYGLANGTTNQTIIDGPLFDKYQFLGPGMYTLMYPIIHIYAHAHRSICT